MTLKELLDVLPHNQLIELRFIFETRPNEIFFANDCFLKLYDKYKVECVSTYTFKNNIIIDLSKQGN